MKIVFVSDLRILIDNQGVYHHHCFDDFYNRYKKYGDVTCCVGKKHVEHSELQIVPSADFAKIGIDKSFCEKYYRQIW